MYDPLPQLSILLLTSVDWNPLSWTSWPFVVVIIVSLLIHVLLPPIRSGYQAIFAELTLLLPAALCYFLVRGLVDARVSDAFHNAQSVIRLEQQLGIYVELELQELVLRSTTISTLMNWIYIWMHWPVVIGSIIWLVTFRSRGIFGVYRNAILLSGAVGMIVFALFPVVPPRLMPGLGFEDTVTLHSQSYRVFQPPALTNPFAAMPSLHFGWNLLIGIAIFREARVASVRWFGAIMPAMMFLAIVLTANHYILDGVAGGALAMVSLLLAERLGGIGRRLRDRLERYRKGGPVVERQAFDWSALPRPFAVAHRAGNSLEDATAALAAGAEVLESDVWLYRDALELRHEKTMGPIPILWDRWSLAPGWRRRFQLDELLEHLDPEIELMLDLKGPFWSDPAIVDRIEDAMRAGRPDRPFLVCSQNWSLLDDIRKIPGVLLVHSIGNRRQLANAWSKLERDDHDAVSIHVKLLDADTVRELKQRVSIVMTWPINDAELLETVLNWGVDGVTTDRLEIVDRVHALRVGAEDRPMRAS